MAPAVVVKGTLSITNSELYFEVDEDEPSFKAIDPKVRERGSIDHALKCHSLNFLRPCGGCVQPVSCLQKALTHTV